MLITIEGIDGTGKSTLIRNLTENLIDLGPVITREPGSTWIGEQVRRGIAEEIDPVAEALLFTADHAAHIRDVIRPALSEGKVVISDRYSDSRYAYQSVTLDSILPDALGWLEAVHRGWTIVPDHTYLLTIPVEEAMKRLSNDRDTAEHFEKADILTRVQKNYLTAAERDPERFVIVDAMLEKEKIGNFVADSIRQFVKR
ncbi:dTMP kinase [Methanogenium marinum]|uniref:Probable thymidylate kinase n=1 Tax=Methanogenium marinum TaxID=348610 RepID=A0A9Q4PWN3_9EURY|nr:dTMP kinase [Methanogenium marinum]MDE4907556.1 dTMP kinase [Methanogenium marinum]